MHAPWQDVPPRPFTSCLARMHARISCSGLSASCSSRGWVVASQLQNHWVRSSRRHAGSPRRALHVVMRSAALESSSEEAQLGMEEEAQEQVEYQRVPCASPCAPGDTRCQQVEAVIQHVLNYPRIPTRVCQWLPSVKKDTQGMTRTIEGMARKYGQELTLHCLRRCPTILEHDIEVLSNRAEHVRSMLDLKPPAIYMILRKNPNLFCLESQVVRTRYNALHKVVPLTHGEIKSLVRKYPLLLNFQTSSVEQIIDALRQLCYTRVQWQEDFENITPTLLAFYIRDWTDILNRMQYLVASGNSPFLSLRDVMKSTLNVFKRTHRGYEDWLQNKQLRERRREQLMAARQERQMASIDPAVRARMQAEWAQAARKQARQPRANS